MQKASARSSADEICAQITRRIIEYLVTHKHHPFPGINRVLATKKFDEISFSCKFAAKICI